MKRIVYICILVFTMFAATHLRAVVSQDSIATIKGKLTYIGADKVYGKPGSADGLSLGDTLKVIRENRSVGHLVIVAISSNSFASEPVITSAQFKVNDSFVITKIFPGKSDEESLTDSEGSGQSDESGFTTEVQQRKSERGNPLLKSSGSVLLQYYGIFNNGNLSTYQEPAALVRWRADQIAETPLKFEIYTRIEKAFAGNLSNRPGSNARPLFRVYNASFSYGNSSTDTRWQIGRIFPRSVSGIGNIDGLLYSHRFNHLSIGGTAGFQPDYYDNNLSTNILKASAFAEWSNDKYSRGGYQGAIAVVGQYRNQNIDREYITIRQSYVPTNSLRLMYSGDFTLDRNDHSSNVGLVTPTNSYLRLNWAARRWMRVGLRYSYLKSVRLFATQENIPDSIFANYSRQGVSGNLYFALPWHISLTLLQSYRIRQGSAHPVWRSAGTLRFRDILGSGFHSGFSGAYTQNEFAKSWEWDVRLERHFGHSFSLEGDFQQYRYTLLGRPDVTIRNNYGAELSYLFRRFTYFSIQYNLFKDANFQTQQLNASLSLNF